MKETSERFYKFICLSHSLAFAFRAFISNLRPLQVEIFQFFFRHCQLYPTQVVQFPALWPPFLDDKSRRTMINHADRFIATSLYKTRKEKEATGWKYKRTFDRDEIFVVRWKVSSGDWNCHVVLIWKQNYCIAGVAGNRLFLALSFHTFAAICQIVEILALRKSLGKSLNLRAIALSLP